MRILLLLLIFANLSKKTVGFDTNLGTPCSQNVSNLWLDLVFVIDTSSAMTKERLAEVAGSVVTILSDVNIAQAGNHSSRAGIVTYASEAVAQLGLDNVRGFDQFESAIFGLKPISDDDGVNLQE